MKRISLSCVCEAEADCPKEVLLWNYYDHEHLVGTHYKHYRDVRILAERDDWALVYHRKRMPFLPLSTSGVAFRYIDKNTMKTFHKDAIGLMLEQDTEFFDLPHDRSRVRVTYRVHVHPLFKFLQPIFDRLFRKWFNEVWAEDMPMRLRRWKVYKLGFKDFEGIEYINKKMPRPVHRNMPPYEFHPPLVSLPIVKSLAGEQRLFSRSVELGYDD